eukprot:6492433-Amphidinium_carterae.2
MFAATKANRKGKKLAQKHDRKARTFFLSAMVSFALHLNGTCSDIAGMLPCKQAQIRGSFNKNVSDFPTQYNKTTETDNMTQSNAEW